MCTLQPLSAWYLFVQALACCQEFDCANQAYRAESLNRPSLDPGLPAEECVYWSCWKSEHELRLVLDLPDFGCEDLSYPLHFPTPPAPTATYEASSWYFYLSEISLRRLGNRVREEICTVLNSEAANIASVLKRSIDAFEGLAEDWLPSLHPAMSLDTPQEQDDVLKFILRGRYLNLWEVMYWPFLELSISGSLDVNSAQTYVRKGLQLGIDRIYINKPGFPHRHHGKRLMVQSCTRSALVILAAAHCAETAFLLPADWKQAVMDVMDLLRFWQGEAADAADRLQILEELL